MSYNLRLGTTTNSSNSLNKTITTITTYNIDLKEKNNNLQNLNITLRIYPTNNIRINYAVLSYGAKILYYFAEILPNTKASGQFILHLTLDPLMTYRDEILNLNCIIERNTNKYNVYLHDSEQKITSQYKQFYHTFRGGDISYFKPHSSILCTLVGSE